MKNVIELNQNEMTFISGGGTFKTLGMHAGLITGMIVGYSLPFIVMPRIMLHGLSGYDRCALMIAAPTIIVIPNVTMEIFALFGGTVGSATDWVVSKISSSSTIENEDRHDEF